MSNKKQSVYGKIFKDGILSSNPLFVTILGTCASLAITTSVMNAVGMFIAFEFVLLLSNVTVSAVRKVVPDEIRIPVYIIIVATYNICISLLMQAYAPELYSALATFIELIVVNCIILGRAEAFASKNGIGQSAMDAVGQGLGYGAALFIISLIREVLGTQAIVLSNPFNTAQSMTINLLNDVTLGEGLGIQIPFFVTPAGAFLTLAVIFAVIAMIMNKKKGENK